MTDQLVRMVARDIGVRAVACDTTALVHEGIQRHQANADTSLVLAHALTSGALMGALLKIGQRVAVKFEGDGPLGKFIVESDSNGNVRGYIARPEASLPAAVRRDDIMATIGPDGFVTVVKDLRLEKLVEGVVPLSETSVAANMTQYLIRSEQIPSLMSIGVFSDESGQIKRSGGLLLQALPPYDVSIFAELQEKLEELPPLDALLAADHSLEAILNLLLAGRDKKSLVTQPLSFNCSCSQERTRQALVIFGREEVSQILTTEGKAIVNCNFCGKTYTVTGAELADLLDSMDDPAGGSDDSS